MTTHSHTQLHCCTGLTGPWVDRKIDRTGLANWLRELFHHHFRPACLQAAIINLHFNDGNSCLAPHTGCVSISLAFSWLHAGGPHSGTFLNCLLDWVAAGCSWTPRGRMCHSARRGYAVSCESVPSHVTSFWNLSLRMANILGPFPFISLGFPIMPLDFRKTPYLKICENKQTYKPDDCLVGTPMC